ncbi:MAG: hypothetical protein WC449_05395 [Candidatus Paceibacterota bacterium]
MEIIILWLRALIGYHNIFNGTTCEISERLWDVHDYHVEKGGDGIPTHFHYYECPNCGNTFII